MHGHVLYKTGATVNANELVHEFQLDCDTPFYSGGQFIQ